MSQLQQCRRLLERAEELRFEDPREALRMAESARDQVAALDREEIGVGNWFALQADAWGVFGSALRSVSDLGDSEGALNVAIAFLMAPEVGDQGDPLAYAHLAQRAAYLRCDQGRYAEALELIDEAISIYCSEGAGQAAAGALADRGLILGRAGRKEEAIVHLGEALEQLDPDKNPRNFLAAVHNTALYMHELADNSPRVNNLALKWLKLAYRCHTLLPPESLSVLKLRTLRGLTAVRLGRVEQGIDELWQAQEGFQRLGAAYEQSLTLLHLASIYQNLGRADEVKRVAGLLFPVFQSLKIDREASVALMLFYNAAQAESATLDLIDRVSSTLREAQVRSLRRGDSR